MSLHGRCLLLNSGFFPVGIHKMGKSLHMLFSERALCVEEVQPNVFQQFDHQAWVGRGVVRGDNVIHTEFYNFDAPSVIMSFYPRVHPKKLNKDPKNVFMRDGGVCWYCGSRVRLTLDHVIPRCKGGQDILNNVVTCCQKCNSRKGDRDVLDFCQEMECELPRPPGLTLFPWMKHLGRNYPEAWKKFLKVEDLS